MIKKILIVGGGFGGIATALRLRAMGHQVTLLERLDEIGGRAQVFEKDGFLHDAGPTVITAPYLFDELFELFDKKLSDYAEFRPLKTWYDFYFHDGNTFSYQDDVEHTLSEIARFNPDDRSGYLKLLKLSEEIFNVGYLKLAHQSFTSMSTMLKQVPSLIRLKSLSTVYSLVCKFIKDPYLRQVFSIHPLLVGGNPHTTTSIYTLIHFLERKWGVHFCMGGTGRLVHALKTLMIEEGIDIKTGVDIASIDVIKNKVVGVTDVTDLHYSADAVVFNGDPAFAYKSLLPKRMPSMSRKPERFTKFSMGLFVLFFGSKGKTFDNIAHHTIWMGPRYKELLEDIFDHKTLADDFSLYLHRPTATDPSFAPEGSDSFYALCPVPNLQADIDWNVVGPQLEKRIIQALDETILPGIGETVTASFWMSPEDFRTRYKSEHGAGFSIAPILTQSAYFRFHNRDSHFSNLFFVGAGTHPGAGLPGVVSSAKVVESLFMEDASNEVA